jgi:glycosyltransferase involved in cell wall biosynthesis
VKLSVLIPTHNPRSDLLARTLAALQAQTLPTADWELLLIDNASSPPVPADRVAWHPHGRVIRAPELGLTNARLAGFEAAGGEVLVWVDDDNLLQADYLAVVQQVFGRDARLGAAGGRSVPEYEAEPPAWYRPDLAPLGCRDLGAERQTARWDPAGQRFYPAISPIGAGLAVRRSALASWVAQTRNDPIRRQFGRTGTALTSGEDNDINLTLLAGGWSLSYEPALSLIHVIPSRRLTSDYQCRMARASFRDFVRVLALHGIRPWPAIASWTVRLRQLKAWFSFRAWAGPAERIRWQGACGQLEGQAELANR